MRRTRGTSPTFGTNEVTLCHPSLLSAEGGHRAHRVAVPDRTATPFIQGSRPWRAGISICGWVVIQGRWCTAAASCDKGGRTQGWPGPLSARQMRWPCVDVRVPSVRRPVQETAREVDADPNSRQTRLARQLRAELDEGTQKGGLDGDVRRLPA